MDKQTTSLFLFLRSEIETLWGDTTLWIWPRSSSLIHSPFRAVSLPSQPTITKYVPFLVQKTQDSDSLVVSSSKVLLKVRKFLFQLRITQCWSITAATTLKRAVQNLPKSLKPFFFLIKAPRTHNIPPSQKDRFSSWSRIAIGCYLLNSYSNEQWLAFSFCFSLNSRWSWFFSKAASHHQHSWSLTYAAVNMLHTYAWPPGQPVRLTFRFSPSQFLSC